MNRFGIEVQADQLHRRRSPRRSRWLNLAPLLLFVAAGMAVFWNAMGDDLASSYVGCRVLATGHAESLYSYDPVNFAAVADKDAVWPRLAAMAGYHGYLHPYVQTPLWAWSLQPLCNHLQFPAFKHLFLLLALLSLAGCIYLTARYWTPSLFGPTGLTLVLAALFFSEPFLFAMSLVQTHALLLLLTMGGLIRAQRGRPGAAGLCVALAAAVKITPGIVLIYWLAARRWRAAASFVVWSLALLAMTHAVCGDSLFHAYIADMRRTSQVLLVAENNQSLASWWMGRFFPPDEVFDVNAFPLPSTVRLASIALMLLFSAIGGLLDHMGLLVPREARRTPELPFGAGIVLVAMTVFGPIAWTHYFIVLVIPLMLLAQAALGLRPHCLAWLFAGAALLIAVLLYRPLAPDVLRMDLSDLAVLRGEFYSGVLTLAALISAGWVQARHPGADASLPALFPRSAERRCDH